MADINIKKTSFLSYVTTRQDGSDTVFPYDTLNSNVATLKTGYNNLYNKVSAIWSAELDSYVLNGYYASIAGWSSLTPLSTNSSWLTILPALNIKYGNGESAGTGIPEYINALTNCSTYGLQLIARENGAKIDVNKTSNGFALTGLCTNMRGTIPYVVAYSAFILNTNNTDLSMPTVVKQHNLYSL